MNDKILDKSGRLEVFDVAEQASKVVEDTLAKKQQSKKDMNKFIYIFGIIAPCLATIQAIKVFYIGNEGGTFGIYWLGYLAVATIWFGYGIYYKNKAVMLVYGLWILVELLILNGIYF